MKVLTPAQIDAIRSHITIKFARKKEFPITGTQMIPPSLSLQQQTIRCHMFFYIKSNQITMNNSYRDLIKDYFNRGIDRFVNSIEKRKKLSIKSLKNNETPTQGFILACDNHSAEVFNTARIPQSILDEWTDMMKGIRFCGAVHGIKVIETAEVDKKDNPTGNYKYRWIQ